MNVYPYLKIARVDHWVKNIFMFPGMALAFTLYYPAPHPRLSMIFIAILSCSLASSANYTINEYVDAESDKHHPVKCQRPGAKGLLKGWLVSLEYFLLSLISFVLAYQVNIPFLITICCLLIMGILYNLYPIRLKDRVYLDTLCESVNSVLRFLLGWFTINALVIPPASILFAYWMGGAFLMSTKRYAEYRQIDNPGIAQLYRRSFSSYTEKSLLLSAFFYAFCTAFLMGAFVIKYKLELVLSIPFFAILFIWYFGMSMKQNSAAQAPENLFREPALMCFAAFTFFVVIGLFYIKIPFLEDFTNTHSLSSLQKAVIITNK